YCLVSRSGSPAVPHLRDWIGDGGLRVTLFPLWQGGVLALFAVALHRPVWLPLEISWNLFHDQLTTPHCTFHTAEELEAWARDAGLRVEERALEAARQLVTLRCLRPSPPPRDAHEGRAQGEA